MERNLHIAQRLSAMLLAPLVLVHLLLILYAVREGLSADAILGRTQGSVGWAAFYALFVVAAAVHAPIGLRNVLAEWTPLPRRGIDWAMIVFGVMLLAMGARAVIAVIGGPL
ncbi:MAG: succinate dehydrogenase [Dichotomicrobium sp.]